MNIVLIGYRGTGKSAVGALLSRYLGRPLIETDREIAKAAGKSIRAIFQDDGEAAFRERERLAVEAAAAHDGVIISTGGGAIVDPANATCLTADGFVVLLQAAPETLLGRIRNDSNRPALTRHDALTEIKVKLDERRTAYDSVAQMTIDTDDLSPQQAAQTIMVELQHRGIVIS